ncbi:MAG: PigN domain-containing protein [Saprospiraceae bacterium]
MLESLQQDDANGRDQIISYLKLRFAIGMLGISLPFLLLLSNYFATGSFIPEQSISDYYDNGVAGDIFVGILFVLGFFLSSYRGEARRDNITASIASIFAICTALFPTTSTLITIRNLHLLSATLLFIIFIYFSFILFRRNKKDPRNSTYLYCAIVMMICILCIIISYRLDSEMRDQSKIIFWSESVALIAFGFSWIVKANVRFEDFKIGFLSKTIKKV